MRIMGSSKAENATEIEIDILLKVLDGRAAEDDPGFVQWLQKDGANVKLYQQMRDESVNADHWLELFNRNKSEAWKVVSQATRSSFFHRYRVAFTAAASLLILFSFWVISPSTNNTVPESVDQLKFVTTNRADSILLEDGTKIWLQKNSTLTYPSSFKGRKQRLVQMSGQASFKVSKNKEQPFIVEAGDLKVTVTGTEFFIDNLPENKEIKTVLLEGSVVLESPGWLSTGHVLKPGQQGAYDKSSNSIIVSNIENIKKVFEWRQSWAEFDDQPLEKMLGYLSEWYHLKFIYSNSGLKNIRFSGRLERSWPERYNLLLLEKTRKVKFIRKGNTVYVTAPDEVDNQ